MPRSVRALATMVVVALSSWSCGSTAPDVTPKVGAIVVSPASSTITLNAQLPLQAEVRDDSGGVVPDAAITWTVEDSRIVRISADGIVTALAVGTSKVAANALGKSGVATVTVASNTAPPPPSVSQATGERVAGGRHAAPRCHTEGRQGQRDRRQVGCLGERQLGRRSGEWRPRGDLE